MNIFLGGLLGSILGSSLLSMSIYLISAIRTVKEKFLILQANTLLHSKFFFLIQVQGCKKTIYFIFRNTMLFSLQFSEITKKNLWI